MFVFHIVIFSGVFYFLFLFYFMSWGVFAFFRFIIFLFPNSYFFLIFWDFLNFRLRNRGEFVCMTGAVRSGQVTTHFGMRSEGRNREGISGCCNRRLSFDVLGGRRGSEWDPRPDLGVSLSQDAMEFQIPNHGICSKG